LFASQYNTKYATSLGRRRRPDPRRWLALFLLSCLFLFCTLDPIGTFSRYFISFGNGFYLHTSSFYFKPSLTDPNGESFPANFQFKCNAEGFTESFKLMVANSIEGEVTDGDISYSITLNEAGANPLFDLYVDEGEGGKTPCANNVINSTLERNLEGNPENSNSHILCFKLKEGAEMPESGSIGLNLVVASSAPYAQSYTFRLSVKAGIGMILIPGTDIERPDVTIEAGEILVFKEEKYEYLTVEDLLVEHLIINNKVQELGRTDLIGGSLYVPASVGTLVVGSNKYINWDVYGHIILEPDILVNAWKPVNMVSHAGDVILNNTTIAGNTQPYQVNITAETGNIEANGTTINSRSAESGIIKLAAQNDIILSESDIASQGNNGIKILSEEGTIDVSNAVINSTNGATAASVVIQTAGHINLDGAQVISNASTALPNPALLIESTNDGISAKSAILTSTNSGKLLKIAAQGLIELDHTPVSSGGPISISTLGDISADSATLTAASNGGLLELLAEGFIKLDQATLSSGGNINIQTPGDISAKSANIFNNSDASYGHSINIYSINGAIDLSTLEVAGIPQTVVNSPPGNINIKAKQDIWCISSSITASSNYSGMVLRFESTGQGSKLYVDNATLSGHSIKAYGLQIEGTPASGNIQQL
jgi:hypothetical protein